MFTYTHAKWFYGQSECVYYLNYFIILVIKFVYYVVIIIVNIWE